MPLRRLPGSVVAMARGDLGENGCRCSTTARERSSRNSSTRRSGKQIAKRNKLFGLWVAERMGLGGAEAEAYAMCVVDKEIVGHGDAVVIGKIMKDLVAAGRPVARRQILSHLQAFDAQVRGEIAEYSRPAD